MSFAGTNQEAHVDFDLHGIVGVRLIDPSPSDVAIVRRQLGRLEQPLDRDPDVVVRFVDELPVEGLRYVEYGRTGFTSDGFFVLQSRKREARVKIAFDRIGDCCEIVCQRGARAVPLLMAIVTITALARDCVPLHASAFVHEGVGVLVTGWAKGGKTEALLAFASHGAEYVGDEWILVTRDGRHMYGIPEHIRLQDWHLRQLPSVRDHVSAAQLTLFRTIRGLDRLHGAVPDGAIARSFVMKRMADALPALRRQLNVQLDPDDIFGRRVRSFSASPDKVFFMVSHAERGIHVDPADPQEIAHRMAASNWYEQQPLISTYLAYRFAFPDRRNDFLERAFEIQSEILSSALAGKDAFMVRHPYPCELGALFSAMAPSCTAARVRDEDGVRQPAAASARESSASARVRA